MADEVPVVLDGLVYRARGYGPELAAGGVTAIHVTVCDFQAEFHEALDAIAAWYGRVQLDGRLRLVRHGNDLAAAAAAGQVAVILGMQNARPVGTNLERIALLKALGVHVIQLTYMHRNYFGDGCLEPEGSGISLLGRQAVREMQRCGVSVDLSHVGRRTTLEALALAERPMLFTHANCRALCENARNKSDEEIRALAATGGVMGISPYANFLWQGPGHPRPSLDDYVAHIEHVAELVGIDHVGFGTDSPVGLPRQEIDDFIHMMNTTYSDWLGPYIQHVGATYECRYADGFVGHADVPNLRRRLRERGFIAEEVAKVLGGNFQRVLCQSWGE